MYVLYTFGFQIGIHNVEYFKPGRFYMVRVYPNATICVNLRSIHIYFAMPCQLLYFAVKYLLVLYVCGGCEYY